MTLLEAISPTAAALFNQPISGGGIVNFQITKNSKTGRHAVHAINPDGRPVCGGGHQARRAQWQTTIEQTNCRRCAEILQQKVNHGIHGIHGKEPNDTCD